jgi:hypothetical protein
VRRLSRTAVLALVIAGILAATAGAAAVGIVSQKIAIFSKTLTHATCTLPGTSVSDDAYTDQQSSSSNFGTATTIAISPRSGKNQRGWIRFNFAACSLPANAQADSATLGVYVTTSMTGRTISVSRVTSSWTAGTITWSASPTVSGTATGTFSAATTGAKTVDVSTDVADFVDGAATNYGWQLADLATAANLSGALGASENATVAQRPTLTINYAY